MSRILHVRADNNPGLSPIPFIARRRALIIGFVYHSQLKLNKSGEMQSSASKSKKKSRLEEKDCL